MNKLYFLKRIAVLAFVGLSAQADLISFSDINEAIPDNDSRGYVNVQTVSGLSGAITNISVSVTLSAAGEDVAFNGDYFMTLQHDSGYTVLLNRVGKTASAPLGYDDNGIDVTFSLTGADIHTSGDVLGDGTLIGTWGVDGRETDPDSVLDSDSRTALLSSFLNDNPNGEWRLFIADMNSAGNGQLISWELNLETVPEPSVLALISFFGAVLLLIRRLRF